MERRHCVLCGKLYRSCECRCTWCGEPIWKLVGGSWQHHIGGSHACRQRAMIMGGQK